MKSVASLLIATAGTCSLLGGLFSERALVADAFSIQQLQHFHLTTSVKYSPLYASSPTRNGDGTIRDDPTVVGEGGDDDDDWETAEESSTNGKVIRFLETKYPTFYKLLVRDNESFLKDLQQESSPHTIFVPNEAAMETLGAKALQQMMDPRNEEIRDKMGQYHLVSGKALSATELRTEDWTRGRPKDGSKPNTLIAAIVTLAGEVPVGRSKSGGFLGTTLGAKDDGDIVIGPSGKIMGSFQVEDCLVHEMDALISPLQLWRYADQLRIPGF